MKNIRAVSCSLGLSVCLTAGLLLAAINGHHAVLLENQAGEGPRMVAGPLTDGTVIEQHFVVPGGETIEYAVLGIRFATYNRRPLGQVQVTIKQGNRNWEHLVDATTLKDNTVVNFALDHLKPGEAMLRLEGVGALPDRSPTAWGHLGATYGPILRDGERLDRSVDLWISKNVSNLSLIRQEIGWLGLIGFMLIFGAITYLLGFLCLRIGVIDQSGDSPKKILGGLLILPGTITGLIAAIIVWCIAHFGMRAPMEFISLKDSFGENLKDAPPLIEGSLLEQQVVITRQMAAGNQGLGIVFATYMRTNHAKIEVSLAQGEHVQKHVINSKTLRDNKERQFIFSRFKTGPAILRIAGINGTGSESPTVWLEPATEPPFLRISGEETQYRLPVLRYVAVRQAKSEMNTWYSSKDRWPVFAFCFAFILVLSLSPNRRGQ
ncbi:MAG: hypothetical protein KJT03_00885 [Verrucomicrobiae bacterium]|nr:hypothetical protein [Verrucomicrobiae bacterium]